MHQDASVSLSFLRFVPEGIGTPVGMTTKATPKLLADFFPDLFDGDGFDVVLGIGAFDFVAPAVGLIGDHAFGSTVRGDPGRVGPTVHHDQWRPQSRSDMSRAGIIADHQPGRSQ